jgi:peptidoglycan/LPS O-acetylase OafA/YrhL
LARAARIYPVHFATLMIVGLIFAAGFVAKIPLHAWAQFGVSDFLANLFMLQAVPHFGAINAPAWTVCCECAAYLAFPLVGWWAARLSAGRALTYAILAMFACVALTQVIGTTGALPPGTVPGNWPISYSLGWCRIAFEFPAGVLLWAWRRNRASSYWWDWAAVGSAGIVVAMCCILGLSPVEFFALPLIAVFIVACSLSSGFVRTFLSTRLLNWSGRVSYSLYMTHFIVLMAVAKLRLWVPFEGASLIARIAVLLAVLSVVVAVAATTYYLVEEPGRRFVRRALAR